MKVCGARMVSSMYLWPSKNLVLTEYFLVVASKIFILHSVQSESVYIAFHIPCHPNVKQRADAARLRQKTFGRRLQVAGREAQGASKQGSKEAH